MSKSANTQFPFLFRDFPDMPKSTDETRAANLRRTFTGGVRINSGMYRTYEEDARYRQESLKRELP
jgi:hypothetical protein